MREDIRMRLEQVQHDTIPEGYQKKNKRGLFPSDWDVKPLKDLSSLITEKAGERDFETLSISAGIGFVNQAEKFGRELSGEQYVNYTVLKRGDFSYNKGNSKTYPQGCIYRLDQRDIAAVPNVFNSFRLLDNICNSDYYAQLFIYGYMNHQLYRLINAGVRNDGLLNLYDKDFYSCKLPVPSLHEQHKIAEILNHCDKVIELKQQLLEEERNRKKWLMQTLLIKNRRDVKTSIGKLTNVLSGATPSTGVPAYWGGDIRWMSSGELNLKRVYEVEGRITKDGLENSGTKMLPEGCVLVGLAGQGKTRGTVAMNYVPLCTNQSIAAILPNESYVSEYLYWNLENRYIELRKLSSGDGLRGGLNLDLIKGVVLYLPPIENQRKIAATLTAAENKINRLEQELTQWQQKKKSLMQLLLTGIVRVTV